MLPPMRPNPITPSCIATSSSQLGSHQRVANGLFERRQTGCHFDTEMYPQNAPAALHQDVEIAARLGSLDQAETVLLIGYIDVRRIVTGDLQEHTGVQAAFVK